MSSLADRLLEVRGRIAAARPGATPADLVAVSKTFPAEAVREAARAPHHLFGESRVQEAVAKIPLCPDHLRWHFIGRLQKNKIRRILPLVEALHSVDSLELAEDINRIAAETGRRPDLYLQVNLAGDAARIGFTPASLEAALEPILGLSRVNAIGLMTIPPLAPEAESSRRYFAALRELRDQLERQSGVRLPGLSMGMSDDFEIAVQEGATIVRVGSAIFGARTATE